MDSPPPQSETNLPSVFTLLLGWFFHLLYHKASWAYDIIAHMVSLGKWCDWVYSVIPYIKSSNVVELGHGPGHLQVALKQAGIQCIGLDLSSQMNSRARQNLHRNNLSATLVQARSQHLPFSSNSLPQIVVTFPTEYIADPRTLTEIYRTLVPGGSAIILLSAWIIGRKPVDRLAAWLFSATWESPFWEDRFLNPARKVGFSVKSECTPFARSKLLFIYLSKT